MKKILTILMAVMLLCTALVGCSSNKDDAAANVNLADVVAKVNEVTPIAMAQDIDDTLLTDIFAINADDVEEYAGKMSMVMTSSDTFIIVKAKEGKLEDVKSALEARLQILKDNQYLPAEMEKANAAKIWENGNYVALILVGNTMVEDGADFDATYAANEVKKAEDAVNSFFSK